MARSTNSRDPGKTIIVVFGLDITDRPRAARFDEDHAEAAVAAARLMGLSVARAETDLAIFLAKELLKARVYKSGKVLVPLIKWGLYDQLSLVLSPLSVPPRASQKR